MVSIQKIFFRKQLNLQFLTKNEGKQVDLRYHSSKVEFVRSFFGRNVGLKKSFRLCLNFNRMLHTYLRNSIHTLVFKKA